jgi:hypothetical protein
MRTFESLSVFPHIRTSLRVDLLRYTRRRMKYTYAPLYDTTQSFISPSNGDFHTKRRQNWQFFRIAQPEKKKKERGGKEKKRGRKRRKGKEKRKGIAHNSLLHFHWHSLEWD